MAEYLNFKHGVYAKLPTALTAGTVYVTTDEGAMYVDLPSSDNTGTKRIRIGETVQFANKDAFVDYVNEVAPPYSTSAFYYIIKENALLKWVEDTSSSTGGKWKQVNSTSDIQTNLTELTKKVTANETSINDLNVKVSAIGTPTTSGYLKNLQDAIDTKAASSDLTALEGRVDTLEKDVDTLEGAVATKAESSAVSALSTKVDSINLKLGEAGATAGTETAFARIAQLEDTIDTKANSSTVSSLESTVNGLSELVATKADSPTVADLAGRVSINETAIDTLNNQVTTINSTLGNKADQSALDELSNVVNDSSTGLVKRVTDLEDNSATKTELQIVSDKASQNSTDIATNATAIEAIQTAIGDGTGLTARLKAVEDRTTNETYGNEALSTKITTNVNAIANNTKAIADNAAGIESNKTNIAANTSDISNLKTLVGDKSQKPDTSTGIEKNDDGSYTITGSLVQNLEWLYGTSVAQTSEITTLKSTVTKNTTSIEANTKSISDNADNIATNTTNISILSGKIGSSSTTNNSRTVWEAIEDNAKNIEGLEDTLFEKINAANGIRYKGGVAGESALPSSGVMIGDTYVATAGFTLYSEVSGSTTQTVYAGDLIIASGTDSSGNDLVIDSNLTWTVVNTGYISTHESQMTVKNNTVSLSSYLKPETGDLGTVSFDSDSLQVTTDGNKIKYDIVWGTF